MKKMPKKRNATAVILLLLQNKCQTNFISYFAAIRARCNAVVQCGGKSAKRNSLDYERRNYSEGEKQNKRMIRKEKTSFLQIGCTLLNEK